MINKLLDLVTEINKKLNNIEDLETCYDVYFECTEDYLAVKFLDITLWETWGLIDKLEDGEYEEIRDHTYEQLFNFLRTMRIYYSAVIEEISSEVLEEYGDSLELRRDAAWNMD